MGLGDTILNSVFGTNIHTIKVSAEQLAAIINDAFIRNATSREELDKIERTVQGSKLIFRRMDSEDGKFHLYVSYFERGLTQHKYVFVKNYETEEVFEWGGLNLGPLKRAVKPYLLQARMNPSATMPPFMPSGFTEHSNTNSGSYSPNVTHGSFSDHEMKFDSIYNEAIELLGIANTVVEVERAQKLFQSISDYRDVPNRLEQCQKKIDAIRENTINPSAREEPIAINPSANADSLIKRAFTFLENNEWKKADAYSDYALDLEPDKAEAYLVKLMIERKVSSKNKLSEQAVPLEESQNFKRALQFADDEFASWLRGCNKEIICYRPIYTEATKLLADAKLTIAVEKIPLEKAQRLFQSIPDYKDVPIKIEECQKKISAIQEKEYQRAISCKEQDTIQDLRLAKDILIWLGNWKDADALVPEIDNRLEKLIIEEQQEKEYQRAVRYKSHDTINYLGLARDILTQLDNWKDTDTLVSEIDIRLEELETERQQQLIEEKKKRRLKRIILAIIVIGIICIGFILF